MVETVNIAVRCADGSVTFMGIVVDDRRAIQIGTKSRKQQAALRDYIDGLIRQSAFPKKNADGTMYKGWDALPAKGNRTEFAWRVVGDDEDIEQIQGSPYRGAVRDTGKKLHFDMPHARRLAVEDVRRRRGPEMAALDAEWMKAFGTGDARAAAAIEAKRQAWRDRPAELEQTLRKAKTLSDITAAVTRIG